MSLRTACNHCNTPMKSRVKHQEIAGAPEDLRKTANMLPTSKADQGHCNTAPNGLWWSIWTELHLKLLFDPTLSFNQPFELQYLAILGISIYLKIIKDEMKVFGTAGETTQDKTVLTPWQLKSGVWTLYMFIYNYINMAMDHKIKCDCEISQIQLCSRLVFQWYLISINCYHSISAILDTLTFS